LGVIEPSAGESNINGISGAANALETKKYSSYIPATLMTYSNLKGIENLEFFSQMIGFKLAKRNWVVF
jgi:ABC-type multidrug transport system ATPase subunit